MSYTPEAVINMTGKVAENKVEVRFAKRKDFLYPKNEIQFYFNSLLDWFCDSIHTVPIQEAERIGWVYCLVADFSNDSPESKSCHYIKQKKNYCLPVCWDAHNDYLVVLHIGKYQDTNYIIQKKFLCNFRIEKTANKKLIERLYYGFGFENSARTICRIVDFCAKKNINIANFPLPDIAAEPLTYTIKRKLEIWHGSVKRNIFLPDGTYSYFIDKCINQLHFNEYSIIPDDLDAMDWVYCLVGNIADKNVWNSKVFCENTKVYCLHWIEYGKKLVLGKPKDSSGFIKIIINARYIKNYRLEKVYDKKILRELFYEYNWGASEEAKNEILKLADFHNKENL